MFFQTNYAEPLRIFSDEEKSLLNSCAVEGTKEEILARIEWALKIFPDDFINGLYQDLKIKIEDMTEDEVLNMQRFLPTKLSFYEEEEYEKLGNEWIEKNGLFAL